MRIVTGLPVAAVGGAAGGAGPRLRHREIPKDVATATLNAANAVQKALGRGLPHSSSPR